MLKIGKSVYKLIGLDTNIISEILQDGSGARQGFASLFAGGHIPCFSIYSLFELRCRSKIFENFVSFFDIYPCMILKYEEQLFNDERDAYPNPAYINPTLLAFSILNTEHGKNLRNIMAITFENPDVLQKEREWPDFKEELLKDWVELRRNYPPKGTHYITSEAIPFVQEATIQQVIFRAPEWARGLQASGQKILHGAFPSVRMILWTIFYRLYMAYQRKPEAQDVFDVLISAPAPYLDAVVTENFQADIYRKAKKLDRALNNLAVYTIKDLRAVAPRNR